MKKCSACKIEKEEVAFFKNRTTKDGLTYQCKVCHSKNMVRTYSVKKRDYQRLYYKKYPWTYSLAWARNRSKRKNRICSLTIEQIKFLWFRDNAYSLKVPSLDRIDSTKGYFLENCRFIEKSLNQKLGLAEYWEKTHALGLRLRMVFICPTCKKSFKAAWSKVVCCSKSCAMKRRYSAVKELQERGEVLLKSLEKGE